MNAAAKKISAVGAATVCAVAMASGAAHAQTAPEPAATASINSDSLSPEGLKNAGLLSVGGPLVLSFFIACDLSVAAGSSDPGSCA